MYDQFKYMLLHYLPLIFEDNVTTHLSASTLTGAVATSLTQPVSKIKILIIFYLLKLLLFTNSWTCSKQE